MIYLCTKMVPPFRKTLFFLMFWCALLAVPVTLLAAEGKSLETPKEAGSQRFITIDFDNVDILLFIKYISELTGKNFIIDKTVKGTVSIISPTKISEEEAYQVFESVLAVNGYTTVDAGVMVKIMPSVRARAENIDTLRHGRTSKPEDKIVTQLIPLTHTTPDDMKKVLAPLVSKTSVIIAHTQSGILIVTDTLSNIQKLLAIIESLDVDYSSAELEVLPLHYATATTIATTINSIFKRVAPAVKGSPLGTTGVNVVPYDRINALIVLAGPGDVLRVKRLVALLDTAPEHDEGNIRVVYLEHANAKELAAVLTALPTQEDTKKGPQKAPSISKNVQIMPDEETNSLIITADRAEFKVLEAVIKKLDIARRMVYLEALIMEVDIDANFDVGVKWIGAGGYHDGTGALLTGFGSGDGFSFEGAVGDTVGRGFSLGLLQQGIQIGGITFPNIGALLKAYEDDSSINVISKPQILTTDNKTAAISVGQNIPYLSQSNSADNAERGYENYEYKDVATKLTITPQINQANTLRLDIKTEYNKVKDLGDGGVRPTTFTRTAETTVLVQDGDTIVIGGMIGNDANEGGTQIPLLGDIPILGWLFKTHSTQSVKTNMFIFITPHIIKNPADIATITMVKEEQLAEVMPSVKEELHRQVSLKHAMTLSDIGFQKLQAKNYDSAKNYFNEALSIDPKSPYALMNLGVICEQEGDIEQAIKFYERVLANGTDEALGNGDTDVDRRNIRTLCRENIRRLLGKEQDNWPYETEDE